MPLGVDKPVLLYGLNSSFEPLVLDCALRIGFVWKVLEVLEVRTNRSFAWYLGANSELQRRSDHRTQVLHSWMYITGLAGHELVPNLCPTNFH